MKSPLKIISSMATRSLLAGFATRFEPMLGVPIALESVGGVDAARRVRDGERFDLVVLAAEAIDALAAEGKVAGSGVALVRSGIVVAVPVGAPRVPIDTEAAVRRAVESAESLGYSTGPSGVYLARLFERWGLADSVRARLVRPPPGVPVARLLASGEVALGFQQKSELMQVQGVEVLGFLPPPIQWLTTFSGAVGGGSAQPQAAAALLGLMASPAANDLKLASGMEPA